MERSTVGCYSSFGTFSCTVVIVSLCVVSHNDTITNGQFQVTVSADTAILPSVCRQMTHRFMLWFPRPTYYICTVVSCNGELASWDLHLRICPTQCDEFYGKRILGCWWYGVGWAIGRIWGCTVRFDVGDIDIGE